MRALTLRNKISIFMLLVAFVQAGLIILAGRYFILPHFNMLQEQEATKNIHRVKSAVDSDVETLSRFVLDWASWDDTYEFVEIRDAHYVSSNLIWESFADNEVNAIAIYDRAANLIWGATFDLDTGQPIEIQEIPVFAQAKLTNAFLLAAIEEPVSGVLNTSAGPFVVAARPVLNSQNEGPSRGVLVMAHRLDDEFASRIGDQVHLRVAVELYQGRVENIPLPPTLDAAAIRVIPPEDLEAAILYPGIDGRPALRLGATMPRSIFMAGAEMTWLSLALLLVSMLVLLLAVWYALRRTVTEPIGLLASRAERAGVQGDPTEFLAEDGGDEISRLSHQIGEMLRNLANARGRLVEQSFNVGMARMASGALHNTSNGFTSLLLTIDATLETLDRLHGGERLYELMAEIESENLDPERRRNIHRFVELYAAGIGGVRSDAVTSLRAVTKHCEDVTRMLVFQADFIGQPMELHEIRWSDVVERALEIIPDARLAGIKATVDPSVKDAPGVRGFGPAVIQVAIEIITNAVEAIHQTAKPRGSLHLQCVEELENNSIALLISDNGIGLKGREYSQLFKREYSTKIDGRSGFGLNWCATLLQDMGGRIRLEDHANGSGLTVRLSLRLAESRHDVSGKPRSEEGRWQQT